MKNTEERLEEIVNGDITNDAFVAGILATASNEENDLIRAYARSFIRENSFKIISRLLLEK